MQQFCAQIVKDSSAEISISVDDSDMADDGILEFFYYLFFLCKRNP